MSGNRSSGKLSESQIRFFRPGYPISTFANALSNRRGDLSTSASRVGTARKPNLDTASKGSTGVSNVSPATTIVVTNTNDAGSGSLRDALAMANDGDTITFAVTGSITLTSAELQITHNVTISGPGATSLAVNGNATLDRKSVV